LCRRNDKLGSWTVAVKTSGQATVSKGKGVVNAAESGLPGDVRLAIRRGPKGDSDRREFLERRIFKATGKSANIVSSAKDLSIVLTESEIEIAEKDFIEERKKYFKFKDSRLSDSEAEEKARRVNIPERVYREQMKETEGLLLIYLFDSYYSFRQEKDGHLADAKFGELVDKEGYNLDIPIVGYAIGFPPIEDDPGGQYVRGDYDLELDEDLGEEPDDVDDLALPDDLVR
jgi:hypothetical protein